MGMFHATDVSVERIRQDYDAILLNGENVLHAFKTVRDVIFLTNYRICFLDKQGLLGRKTEVMSVPYRSIVRFSVETAGTFDLEAEMKFWLSSTAEPIEVKIGRGSDTANIQRIVAAGIFGRG